MAASETSQGLHWFEVTAAAICTDAAGCKSADGAVSFQASTFTMGAAGVGAAGAAVADAAAKPPAKARDAAPITETISIVLEGAGMISCSGRLHQSHPLQERV